MVAVACRRWSFTRGFTCKALTGKAKKATGGQISLVLYRKYIASVFKRSELNYYKILKLSSILTLLCSQLHKAFLIMQAIIN